MNHGVDAHIYVLDLAVQLCPSYFLLRYYLAVLLTIHLTRVKTLLFNAFRQFLWFFTIFRYFQRAQLIEGFLLVHEFENGAAVDVMELKVIIKIKVVWGERASLAKWQSFWYLYYLMGWICRTRQRLDFLCILI